MKRPSEQPARPPPGEAAGGAGRPPPPDPDPGEPGAESAEALREKIIGFGARSGRKTYYPELRQQLVTLRASEERFRAVFDGAAIGIAVVDLAGRLQSTNRALQELLGRSDQELRGQPLLAVVHPDDRGRYGVRLEALLRGASERGSHEVRLARADGGLAWGQVNASIAIGDDGAPAYLVAAIQDVTVRRRAQEALEFLSRASVRLATSLEMGPTLAHVAELAVPALGDLCALSTDEEGRAHRHVTCADPGARSAAERLLAHPAAASALGLDAAGGLPLLVGDAAARLGEAARDDPALRELLRALELRSSLAVPLTAASGRLGVLLIAATARSGRSYGPFDLDLATELGHRAALALESARLLLRAREASRLKDEFLAIVSHELRTPLTAMLGWTGLLQGHALPPERTAAGLAVLDRNARALAQIIDDLLSVTRIVAGKLEIVPTPTALGPVVESAVEALRPGAAASQVALVVAGDPGLPPVLGDAARLQQVVWNLVSNAVKYTPAGGRVEVRLKRVGGAAELTVRDTGAGIAPDFLPHVFERFRQADSSTTRRHGGLGLGLTIVHHLVKAHGSTLRAESEGEGRGACFTVAIPLAGAEAAARAAPSDEELPILGPLRILVVEDDPDSLQVLREILERQGALVTPAPSASRALHELDRAAPDLLISDIAMPEQDGVALIQAVRTHSLPIPALALSALSREEDRARALTAGFDRYLVKPLEVRALLQAVAAHASARADDAAGAGAAPLAAPLRAT
jgi:PAS domain S-box-containing protein